MDRFFSIKFEIHYTGKFKIKFSNFPLFFIGDKSPPFINILIPKITLH
jgi:hypothetical protein